MNPFTKLSLILNLEHFKLWIITNLNRNYEFYHKTISNPEYRTLQTLKLISNIYLSSEQ